MIKLSISLFYKVKKPNVGQCFFFYVWKSKLCMYLDSSFISLPYRFQKITGAYALPYCLINRTFIVVPKTLRWIRSAAENQLKFNTWDWQSPTSSLYPTHFLASISRCRLLSQDWELCFSRLRVKEARSRRQIQNNKINSLRY